MNPKHTFILVFLAAGLLGYILLVENRRPVSEEPTGTAARIFPELNPADVERIEVLRTNQVILVERNEGHWQLVNPRYPARSQQIEEWLGQLSQMTRRATLTAEELQADPAGAAGFGLDPPAIVVKLDLPSRRIQFRLGIRTAVGDKTYLQEAGSNTVVVTDAVVLDGVPNSASDWRSPMFVDLSRLAFNRFSATAGTSEFEMQFEPERRRWRMTRPRTARVNESRFVQALQQLQALRVAQFVQDAPGIDLEPYGLDEPALALEFGSGTNVVFGAQFGQSPTNHADLVYARRSDYPNVVLVSRQVLDAFGVPYRSFLDYRLVDAPIDQVTAVDVQAVEPFSLQQQTNGGWRVVRPESFPADPVLVRNFLNRLATMKIVEVAKEVVTDLDLPNYGLANPALAFRFKVTPGTNALAADLPGLDFGTSREGRTFVRRTDENPIYTVMTDEVLLLPAAAYQLRDRRLWDFATNQVVSVTIHRNGRSEKLVRSPAGQWSFAEGSQGIVNTFALEEAVFRLGKLWARAWVDHGPDRLDQYGIPQLDHWLEVELAEPAEPRVRRVAFGAISLSGGPYAVVDLEGEPVVFEFPLEIYHVYQDVIESLKPL